MFHQQKVNKYILIFSWNKHTVLMKGNIYVFKDEKDFEEGVRVGWQLEAGHVWGFVQNFIYFSNRFYA